MAISANFNDVAGEFRQIASQSDFRGLAGLGLIGGVGGGVLTDQLTDRILPLLGMSANPTSAQGLATSGLLKWALAFLFAWGGVRLGRGTLSNFLAVGALGPVVTGAVDLVDAVNAANFLGSMPNTQANMKRATGQTNGRSRAAIQRQPEQTPQQGTATAHQPIEEQRTAASAGY